MSNTPLASSEAVEQLDVTKVLEMASEPSYVSEIARKLVKNDPSWEVELMTAIKKVSSIVSMIDDRDDVDIYVVEYDSDAMGQEESSPLFSIVETDDESQWMWHPYTVIHYTTDTQLRPRYQDIVDKSVTVEDKVSIIETLSGNGNQLAKDSEKIMQDTMKRQFKEYETIEVPHYNDPGVDFYVEDEGRREYALSIEVSTRYVNPIDWPYMDSKLDKAMERDADLVILAPKFTDELTEEYEDPDSPGWHDDPLDQIAHLHRVPPDEPTVYYPFSKKPDGIEEGGDEGNPVIIPDSESARERLKHTGNVGDDYPVVDGDNSDMLEALDAVSRDFTVVTESQYRNALREAIEPLLWNFLKPYKIEQFLQQMYWDENLSQDDIGKLVDRRGGTIGYWMREWGVMRRMGGAPELSQEVKDIWRRMYEGADPFPNSYSGYRIQAEYNRRPLWDLDDWEEWFENTTEMERREVVGDQSSHHEAITYTLMYGPEDRLQPSYSFIIRSLKEMGVEIRPPDEAPRGSYSAYPSKTALEYMLNVDEETIVETEEDGS